MMAKEKMNEPLPEGLSTLKPKRKGTLASATAVGPTSEGPLPVYEWNTKQIIIEAFTEFCEKCTNTP